jgi:tRNA modification GTPase
VDTKYFSLDTIIAPATPLQAGAALGIVRLSGPDALKITSKVVIPNSAGLFNLEVGVASEKLESHRLYQAKFFSSQNKLIDLGLFVWMRGPNSFTGEDVVEFHLHGNPLILHEVINAALSTGLVRMAEAGEFSFRAFRNGKIDLAQAESISSLISAKSLSATRASARALEGATSSLVKGLRDRLVNILAQVELDIDFADQGVPQLDFVRLISSINSVSQDIEILHNRFLKSRPVQDGIQVAIVGAPNSGKSTLFNQILRMDRSIVSDVAGTTRDVVRESVYYSGLLFVFADTAGIRLTPDLIEQKGIERSYLAVESSDVVLLVVDSTSSELMERHRLEEMIQELKSRRAGVPVFLCLNKADALSDSQSKALIQDCSGLRPYLLSALSGQGVENLLDALTAFFLDSIGGDDTPGVWHIRHGLALEATKSILLNLNNKLTNGMTEPDLISVDLRAALDQLRVITGEFSSEDLLNHIFSKFCIGK